MSKPQSFFDFVKALVAAIFGLFGGLLRLFTGDDHASEADATASRVHRDTERLLASEPEQEPTYELATTAREALSGSDINIDHLPPRQRFGILAMKEKRIDPSIISDRDLEAYVRGDHRAHDLPDIVDRRWLQDAWDAYREALRPARRVIDDEPDSSAPAYGM